MDSIDEIKERLTEESEDPSSSHEDSRRDRAELEILAQARRSYDEVKLREVVRGGIGNVNVGDVMMARTAKGPQTNPFSALKPHPSLDLLGPVLAYEVGVNPDALKLAETKGVPILYFNKMQVSEFVLLRPLMTVEIELYV
jgi:translation initiation factor IF-2